MAILEGAIIGAVAGLAGVLIANYSKKQKFLKIRKSITDPDPDYIGMFHMASYRRYKKSVKFFDSYGALYLRGDVLNYKSDPQTPPLTFDLSQCTVQQEPDWKMLKWFSVTSPVGEKYYFNSHTMGAFKSNSDETYKALEIFRAKAAS